jgi:uncharacterized protein (DUF362 family)
MTHRDCSHRATRRPEGRTIDAPALLAEYRAREVSRRRVLEGAIASSAVLLGGPLVGCGTDRPAGVPDAGMVDAGTMDAGTVDAGRLAHLVGMGQSETYLEAFDAALSETTGLSFVRPGDTVYLKVNCNNGDFYPHSTNPVLITELVQRCRDLGATRAIVGDRSFWGDPDTMGNMRRNGVAAATIDAGAELVVFDDASVEWVAIDEADAPTWNGGFRLPVPVMEADHIINLPCVKTHFISTFTMSLKNMFGLVHPIDRERPGNLDVHRYPQLWSQIAEVNRHITPILNILDGHEALITGGPTRAEPPGPSYAEPHVFIISPDRVAADVMGIALLQTLSPTSEDVTRDAAWANPQIAPCVAADIGVHGPDELDVAGPTVTNLDAFLANARRTS